MTKRREFIVKIDVTFQNAECFVMARSAEEALKLVAAGHVGDGIDTTMASMSNWQARSAKENL